VSGKKKNLFINGLTPKKKIFFFKGLNLKKNF